MITARASELLETELSPGRKITIVITEIIRIVE